MGFHHLVNTVHFSEAANDFRRNKGQYTKAPVGSRDYNEYWDLQEKRCREGYSVGGLWIPGRHYDYLNFSPIMKVADDVALKVFAARRAGSKIGAQTAERIFDFPRFYEIDYEWYNFKHIAWNGGTFMGVSSPGAKHIACGKTRGAGFSYKEAADGVYNFKFIPYSKSYYFAGIEQYLTTDGILNKVLPMLDFVNEYIHPWKQSRQKKNTLMHMKASYVDNTTGAEKGNMAEIIGVSIDDPDKTRGKRGRKIVFEEAGSFRNLKKALNVSIGSIRDGEIYVGQISLFGTGGEEGPDIEGLEEIFEDPGAFDMLEFPNIWEKGMEGTSCGYFVPVWRTQSTFMDPDGNVDMQASIDSEKQKRAIKKKAKDPKVLDGYKAEYPFKPSEMFNRYKKNMFDVAEVKAQIKRIETQESIQLMLRYGQLNYGEKGVEFTPQPKEVARPIENYPHTHEDNLEGCVTIVQPPYRGINGLVPHGMYKVIVDPYYKEESESITSLCSVAVWKQYNNLDSSFEGLPVAWWEGRPQLINTAYKNIFMLSDLYNADVQSEIAGGGQGIIDYAKSIKKLDRLCYEPLLMGNKEFVSAAQFKNRSIFMNMPTEKKRLGLTYLANWLIQPRGATPDGNSLILNVHMLYWIRKLKEMKVYDGEKNADAISNGIIAMYELKETAYQAEEIPRNERAVEFYERQLYGDEAQYSPSQTTDFY